MVPVAILTGVALSVSVLAAAAFALFRKNKQVLIQIY